MSPLKLVIPGHYWDSFIYAGRLYLFDSEGSLQSIHWDGLIQSWRLPEVLRIAFTCAFQRSDYLYLNEVQELLRDPEVRKVVKSKFERLTKHRLEISASELSKYATGKQDSPCPFPHTDLEVYAANMYFSSSEGIHRATCNKKTRYPIGSRPIKMWDAPSLGISASYGALAVAAGNAGLFELDLGYGHSYDADENLLSRNPCRDCNWTYFNVFASSPQSGFLAEFSQPVDGKYDQEAARKFERVETADEIFGSQGYSWGVRDKLCQASANSIRVIRYNPWNKAATETIEEIGSIPFEQWKGDVISATTASFGVVVELENAIVVFPSKGKPITLRGEPVNWRVFPRSKHYENQLHVIYDDRLEVFSFNQDYLVSQKEKIIGTSVFSASGRQYRYGRPSL